MPTPKIVALSMIAAGLLACSTPPDPGAPRPGAVEAPLLRAQWWRTEFYGYDTASYRLRESGNPEETDELLVDIHYGGSAADFRDIEWPGSGPRPVRIYQYSADRCQVFGGLQSRCVYHEVLGIGLPRELLERSRKTGLVLVLRAKSGADHDLAMPSEYLDVYLNSIRKAR